MANEQNLKPGEYKLTLEEQKKGGKASAEARRRKRDMRLALEMLLERDIPSKDGKTMTGTEAISAKLFEQALKGNVKAYETIRATVGQDPVQKVQVAEIDKHVAEEIEGLIDEIEKGDS